MRRTEAEGGEKMKDEKKGQMRPVDLYRAGECRRATIRVQ